MSERVKWSVIVLSFALLALLVPRYVVKADPPATAAAQAAASPGQTALDKAAKDNKYLFIYFYAEQDASASSLYGAFQAATAKLAKRADAIAIQAADPAEKAIIDRFKVRERPLASGHGYRPDRCAHPRISQDVHRRPARTGVREPLHRQVHAGHF